VSTPIYHMTNIDNLPNIIEMQGLLSNAERIRRKISCVEISHSHLKSRRAKKQVLNRAGQVIAAGGTLDEYVPFYFANRSPMLYSINIGNVKNYSDGQTNIIYLVSSVEQIKDRNRPWFFTDGHAVEFITEFLIETEQMNKIDWEVINSWSWHDQDDDTDRCRRKQAELLVYKSIHLRWFDRIGVFDEQRALLVEKIFDNAKFDHRPKIMIEPNWFYTNK